VFSSWGKFPLARPTREPLSIVPASLPGPRAEILAEAPPKAAPQRRHRHNGTPSTPGPSPRTGANGSSRQCGPRFPPAEARPPRHHRHQRLAACLALFRPRPTPARTRFITPRNPYFRPPTPPHMITLSRGGHDGAGPRRTRLPAGRPGEIAARDAYAAQKSDSPLSTPPLESEPGRGGSTHGDQKAIARGRAPRRVSRVAPDERRDLHAPVFSTTEAGRLAPGGARFRKPRTCWCLGGGSAKD